MINKNDINKISEAVKSFGVFGDNEADSLDVPPISKDWFTKEWRLNKNNDSYRFKVRSIEYTDDRVMIRIIGEEPIDSNCPTSFYSGGTAVDCGGPAAGGAFCKKRSEEQVPLSFLFRAENKNARAGEPTPGQDMASGFLKSPGAQHNTQPSSQPGSSAFVQSGSCV